MLAREIFYSLKEAQVLIEMWRTQYNTVRPHSALGYRPPAPDAFVIQPALIQPVGLTLKVVQKMGQVKQPADEKPTSPAQFAGI